MTPPVPPAPGSPVLIAAAAALDPALIGEIAAGRSLRLTRGLLGGVQDRCDLARVALASGTAVYGVNTGMGALSGVRLTDTEQRAHQRNLLLARAVGGPPWLEPGDVRAIFAVRLRTFLSGDAGVSGQLCERLADFLNSGLTPAVPVAGVGSAGEIIPLAHAFGPLAGIGHAVRADGRLQAAGDALSEHQFGEFVLGPKEGIALLAGVPGATALTIRRVAEARALVAAMEAAAALSVVAANASRDPYAAACGRGDETLSGVIGRLRALAGDSQEPAALQAPVSFRVAGPVLAHLLRACAAADAAVGRALAGVTDSPAFTDGRFTGTAGFHGIDLAACCDGLTAALAHGAEVAAARIHRLLDPRITGLAAQLAAVPGPDAGLVAVHKRAAGEVHAMRRMTGATPVGLIETSGGQEDVQSFGWEAAENLRQALRCARAVTACELLTAYQGCALAGRPAPPGCARLLDWLATLIPPILDDRPFGEDIELISAELAGPGLQFGAIAGHTPAVPRRERERSDIR